MKKRNEETRTDAFSSMEYRHAHLRITTEDYYFNQDEFFGFITKRFNNIFPELKAKILSIFKNYIPSFGGADEVKDGFLVKYLEDSRSIEFPLIFKPECPDGVFLVIEIFPLRLNRFKRKPKGNKKQGNGMTNIYSNFRYNKAIDRKIVKDLIKQCEKAGEEINRLIYGEYIKLHNEYMDTKESEEKRMKMSCSRIYRLITLGIGSETVNIDSLLEVMTQNSKKKRNAFCEEYPHLKAMYKEARKIFKLLHKKNWKHKDFNWMIQTTSDGSEKTKKSLIGFYGSDDINYGNFVVWSNVKPEQVTNNLHRVEINTFLY